MLQVRSSRLLSYNWLCEGAWSDEDGVLVNGYNIFIRKMWKLRLSEQILAELSYSWTLHVYCQGNEQVGAKSYQHKKVFLAFRESKISWQEKIISESEIFPDNVCWSSCRRVRQNGWRTYSVVQLFCAWCKKTRANFPFNALFSFTGVSETTRLDPIIPCRNNHLHEPAS